MGSLIFKGRSKGEQDETPFAILRFAHLFDGNHSVEEIDNFDVSFRLKLAINLQDIIQLHDIIRMCFFSLFFTEFFIGWHGTMESTTIVQATI